MSHHFYLYNNDVFFHEGVRTIIANLFTEQQCHTFIKLEGFSQLVDTLSQSESHDESGWVLCDVDYLPHDRFNALHVIKNIYGKNDHKLIMMLDANSISLFFALYTVLPNACWLLKNESLKNTLNFFRNTCVDVTNDVFFSLSLVSYTRQKWLSREVNENISREDWWLMEEIFKGKSLSQISLEQDVDIRRLSRHKRGLMKKLNASNNIELFNIFRCMMTTS